MATEINVKKEVEEIIDEVINHRRFLHQNPEIADELPITTEYIVNELKKSGYEPKEITKCGITALVGNPNGKTLLIRADTDALDMEEETDLSFKSTNGRMHACGHDMHTAIALGAAKILKKYEKDLKGYVKFMFQPGEEYLLGAVQMVEAGILENPKVDAAIANHVFSSNPCGEVIINSGAIASSSDIFKIVIKGKGCHGALPQTGIDPINIGSHIILSVQALNSREVDPLNFISITFGKFDGGQASNIIPDEVIIEGTIRTRKPEVREFVKKRLSEIVVKTADLFNGKATLEYVNGTPALVTDKDFINEIMPSVEKIVKKENIKIGTEAMSGSEDFAYVSEKVPSAFFLLMAGAEDKTYPMHNPKVKFNEDIMKIGIANLVQCAIDWL